MRLSLLYILGWLPALIGAIIARRATGSAVLSGAGEAGIGACIGLGLTLALLSTGYLTALRRPPSQHFLLVAGCGSLLMALAMPVLFSADVYAYAYYGDLAVHGQNPYGHHAPPLLSALTSAAIAVWDGHIPPRCVYGPIAVAVAAAADVAGTFTGVAGQIFAQRAAAAAAYFAVSFVGLRLVQDPRARVALLLNPVLIWSSAEGHNDGAMVALVLTGFSTTRHREIWLTGAALVKGTALVAFGTLRNVRARLNASAALALGYAPLIFAIATDPPATLSTASPAAWQSPLGLVAGLIGRWPALGIALLVVGLAAVAARRLNPADRTAAIALAAWFALPNAYPWYAWWIVPLAARRLESRWSVALLVASLTGAARAMTDAIFPAPGTFDGAHAFHGRMIALEYLPPLLLVARQVTRTRRLVHLGIAPLMIAAMLIADGRSAYAQQTAGPSAAPTPAPPGAAAQSPVPVPVSTTTPQPSFTPPTVVPGFPTPNPTPVPAPYLTPAPTAIPVVPAPTAVPAPPATPLANPFNYVITPTPAPITTPDGPHIIEVLLNDRRIRAGGPLVVRVLTSPNVVGVEARALGRFIAIPQSSPGQFSLAYTLPGAIPFWFLNKNYDIVIAAATADGRQTTVSFPMLLTR